MAKSRSWALIKPKHRPGQGLMEYSRPDVGSLGGSIVESTDWMVLHRPVELASFSIHYPQL
jgi:hypothetical protein